MWIWNECVEMIIKHKSFRAEYHGTHAPHNNTPLYGRRAYWRIYVGDRFIAKVTTPVKSMNPKQATLDKLLKAEIKKRIEAISERVELDHYGMVVIIKTDPYSIRPLTELIEGQYNWRAA